MADAREQRRANAIPVSLTTPPPRARARNNGGALGAVVACARPFIFANDGTAMVINCCRCGRPVCAIDPPEFKDFQVRTIMSMLAGIGLDVGNELEAILRPTPEGVAAGFQVRCPNGC